MCRSFLKSMFIICSVTSFLSAMESSAPAPTGSGTREQEEQIKRSALLVRAARSMSPVDFPGWRDCSTKYVDSSRMGVAYAEERVPSQMTASSSYHNPVHRTLSPGPDYPGASWRAASQEGNTTNKKELHRVPSVDALFPSMGGSAYYGGNNPGNSKL